VASYYDVLIVGSGHAGAQAAISLRQRGFAGSIAIVTEESEPPYERPPLSKEYLAGSKGLEQILLRPAAFWGQRHIAVLNGCRVTRVDTAARRVMDSLGTAIGYGRLIWAAGGRARRLTCQGGDLPGVHGIRSRADVDVLRLELQRAQSIVIIGGGYIGLEAAASLAGSGKRIILLEMEDRVLARVAGEPLSRFYEAEHRAKGADVRLNARVECIVATNGHASGVRMVDGHVWPAPVILVGIGIIPEVAPLADAGATGTNGVDVDEHCRTSLADVYAIGDCAAHENAFAGGRRIRLESIQNAADQAACAAAHIVGKAQPYRSVPWFWSHQYDLKLQTVGLALDYDETILRGEPAARSFSLIYRRRGLVIAIDCVNTPKDFVQGKALVLAPGSSTREQLMDLRQPLKSLSQPAPTVCTDFG
jgi:3-phenylpropionate/trans-cinnamate dioxygenase ferredoxin reductase subunit